MWTVVFEATLASCFASIPSTSPLCQRLLWTAGNVSAAVLGCPAHGCSAACVDSAGGRYLLLVIQPLLVRVARAQICVCVSPFFLFNACVTAVAFTCGEFKWTTRVDTVRAPCHRRLQFFLLWTFFFSI